MRSETACHPDNTLLAASRVTMTFAPYLSLSLSLSLSAVPLYLFFSLSISLYQMTASLYLSVYLSPK
jgi:hypothetical protein